MNFVQSSVSVQGITQLLLLNINSPSMYRGCVFTELNKTRGAQSAGETDIQQVNE